MANTSRRADPGSVPSAAHGSGAYSTGLDEALAYVPRVLIDGIARQPDRESPWCDVVEGTLLMADVSGFTAMSEALASIGKEGAEWLTDIINSYFDSMLSTARELGGDVITFGGDAMLLLYRGPEHATRACASALGMLDKTERLAAFKVGSRRIHLGMSMGAHSGTFVLGSAGLAGSRHQCLLFGPGATLTCKAEAAADKGELRVTRETVAALGGVGTFEERDEFFRVQGVEAEPMRGRRAHERRAPDALHEQLLPYLPPAVAACVATGAPMPVVESDHRKVCVVFINVMGVDELLESAGPEAVLGQLQRYVEAVVRLADRHNGYVVSNDVYTLGIKLIVAFGAPVAHEHDTANALRMAAGLRQEVDAMSLDLAHRIGVNSGFVFAGDVGPSYRRQYTVMGDAVNLSARLMSAAGPGQIYVSAAALDEAGTPFEAQTLEPIFVKGKKQPIPLCALIGECSTLEPRVRAETRLFGRDEELRALQQATELAASGHGRVAVVRGEPGIGKSRLTQELREELEAGSWIVAVGACQSHTAEQPFAPWTAPLLELLDVPAAESSAAKARAVENALRELLPESVRWNSLLGPLLGVALPDTAEVRALDDSARRERLFELVADVFRAKAAVAPTALFVEDLHWADASSIALIEHLLSSIPDARVLVVLTSRLEPPICAQLPDDALCIDLQELPSSSAVGVLSELLGREGLPEEMARILLEKARGNPLFLQEVARSLAGSGELDKLLSASGSMLAEEMASLEIPDKVQGLVMARIDALSSRTKEVLRTASVVGFTFERSTLLGVIEDLPSKAIDEEIATLAAQSLADRDPSAAELTFRFRHALIQEVAYDSLMFSKRRQLHRRIGEHLELTHSADLEPLYENLVHHFSAGRDDKTRSYAVLAAGKARRLFAHEEAAAYYRRALQTVRARTPEATTLRSCLLECVGDCLESTGRHKDAATELKKALRQWRNVAAMSGTLLKALPESTDAVPPRAREAALCHKLAVCCEHSSDYQSSLEWLEAALASLPPRQPLVAARIYATKSMVLFRKSEYGKAIDWGRKGVALARRSGDRKQHAMALVILSNSYFELGQFRQAIRMDERVADLYDQLGDLHGQGLAHTNLAISYQQLGDLKTSLHHFGIALGAWERLGNATYVSIASMYMSDVLLIQGRTEEARVHLNNVLETHERRLGAATINVGMALVGLARVHQKQGEYDKAMESMGKGIALLRKAGSRGTLVEACLRRAELELDMGDLAKALRTTRQACKQGRALGMQLMEVRAETLLGRIALAKCEYDTASAHLEKGAELAGHLSLPYEQALAMSYLAEVLASHPDRERPAGQANALLDRAIAAFSRMGAADDLARARRLEKMPGVRWTEAPTLQMSGAVRESRAPGSGV